MLSTMIDVSVNVHGDCYGFNTENVVDAGSDRGNRDDEGYGHHQFIVIISVIIIIIIVIIIITILTINIISIITIDIIISIIM